MQLQGQGHGKDNNYRLVMVTILSFPKKEKYMYFQGGKQYYVTIHNSELVRPMFFVL